jgi:hypothetical protein
MDEALRRRPGRPRKPERIVGRDPLGRFDGAHPSDVLRLQGVDHRPKPSPRKPTEMHEEIGEAPEDSEAPVYESKRPRMADAPVVKRNPIWMPEPAWGERQTPIGAGGRRRPEL